ncbi:PREDICTED: uncharacterized protein LOC108362957 [Rhagoletis zephyria]|uniref:uncharacterized protein LOC108362957 n=1 Tax=Rhagoletis zephyria TaxID=28612 RepID=UPI00081131FB|nr:PREDICTED: uncharacterized protein LOC108362957 [Rhagoletis zephyria]
MEFKLIEAVQMHPCLYDKSIVAYRNRLGKEKAWNYVAAATGCSGKRRFGYGLIVCTTTLGCCAVKICLFRTHTAFPSDLHPKIVVQITKHFPYLVFSNVFKNLSAVEQCQSRWRSLRDRFVKEESGRKAPSGSAANDKDGSGWKYYEALAFLQRHVAPRKTFGNTTFGTNINFEKCTPQPEQSINVYESQPLFEYSYDEEPVIEQTQQTGLPTVVQKSTSSLVDFQPEEEPIVTPSRALSRKKDEERLDTLCGAVSDWLKKSEAAPS